MLSCKKATELMEKKSLIGLSGKENFRLKLHTTMCDACSAYQKQSLLIDQLLEHHITTNVIENSPNTENEELENRIITKLKYK